MFNKYTVETKLIKKPKPLPELEAAQANNPNQFVLLLRENLPLIANATVISVASYVLLDTVRQVAVKIAPQH